MWLSSSDVLTEQFCLTKNMRIVEVNGECARVRL